MKTSKMQYILERTPHLGEHILQHLDHKSLISSKTINRNWKNFLGSEKYFKTIPVKKVTKSVKIHLT